MVLGQEKCDTGNGYRAAAAWEVCDSSFAEFLLNRGDEVFSINIVIRVRLVQSINGFHRHQDNLHCRVTFRIFFGFLIPFLGVSRIMLSELLHAKSVFIGIKFKKKLIGTW